MNTDLKDLLHLVNDLGYDNDLNLSQITIVWDTELSSIGNQSAIEACISARKRFRNRYLGLIIRKDSKYYILINYTVFKTSKLDFGFNVLPLEIINTKTNELIKTIMHELLHYQEYYDNGFSGDTEDFKVKVRMNLVWAKSKPNYIELFNKAKELLYD